MKKYLLPALIFFYGLQSCAQKMTDLSQLNFSEPAEQVLKSVPTARKGMLYDQQKMLSYGIENNNGAFSFAGYKPEHIELLTFNDKVAGYAFRITSFEDQQKIEAYLKKHYSSLRLADSSQWGRAYQYTDNKIVIDFRSIAASGFNRQMKGYLDIKNVALKQAVDEQEKKYKKEN